MKHKKLHSLQMRYSQSFGDYMQTLIDLLSFISSCEIEDEIQIDGSKYEWSSPFVTLPLCCLLDDLRTCGYKITLISFKGSYLNNMYFPQGMDVTSLTQGLVSLSYYDNKTYIPNIKLTTTNDHTSVKLREKLQSQIHSLISRQLNLNASMKNALTYLIDELVNNAIQHSQASTVWLAAQYYPKEHFLDLAIVDPGISILGSYKASKFEKYRGIETHVQALDNAINGESTKEDKQSEGSRGFGIRTSKRMLVKGLNGKLVLLSGNAFLQASSQREVIVNMDGITSWKGTSALLRVPMLQDDFKFYDYVE